MDLLKAAQEEAAAVLERDPELSEPENRALRERIAALFELKTAALN
jgi:hypothetical protein